MFTHYIIMASAYSIGKRMVLDYCLDETREEKIHEDFSYIEKAYGSDIPVSTHTIQTNSRDFDSVRKLDKFFADTKLIKTKEEFVDLLLKDKELIGLDVAKYVLSKIPCTHLKLEKLVYMCYADYLCLENEKLFNDNIYAYRLGPVIDSIYKKYKNTNKNVLEEDNEYVYNFANSNLSSKSRILSSKDGIKKLSSIERTLKKYGNYSASELVKITHKKFTPWTISGGGDKDSQVIDDNLIFKYHQNEIL